MENFAKKITPMPGEQLTQEKALEATKKIQKGEDRETIGQLRFELENIKERIVRIRNERTKERKNIVDAKGMDIIEKNASLKRFDEETVNELAPLIEERDALERRLGEGHA